MSLFADGEIGADDWERVFVGVRFYFGGETKSLILRHRQDNLRPARPWFAMRGQCGQGGYGDEIPCWVAREVYGADSPEWRIFRIWLLNKAPDWFRILYIRRGERFANWISDKTLLKKLIRIWMDTRLIRAV